MTASTYPQLPPAVAAVLARASALHSRYGARLPGIVALLLALLASHQLATLFWTAVPTSASAHWQPAPAFVDTTPLKPVVSADAIGGAHLFGEYRLGANADAALLANAPDTLLNFTLIGILASSRDAESLALIAKEGGGEAPYAIGDDIASGVNLQAIFPDRVILSRNGKLETLRLDKDSASNAQLLTTNVGEATAGSVDAAAMLSQIRQQVVTDPTKAANFIRVQPLTGEAGVRGYRVYPGPERAAFNAAGLKPGDVVTAINGVPLDDPAKALQLLQNLSNATTLNLAVERNGTVQSVNLSVNP